MTVAKHWQFVDQQVQIVNHVFKGLSKAEQDAVQAAHNVLFHSLRHLRDVVDITNESEAMIRRDLARAKADLDEFDEGDQ